MHQDSERNIETTKEYNKMAGKKSNINIPKVSESTSNKLRAQFLWKYISKESIHDCRQWGEVRYQSGSAAWQILREGTEAVMGQQLPDICMELYLNIQQALICYSCKDAVLRSPSDLIPVSCSVYPADTSVQKLHQIQPCTFGCKYMYVCTRICIGHMKEKKNCTCLLSLQQDHKHRTETKCPFHPALCLTDFSRSIAELNTAHVEGG